MIETVRPSALIESNLTKLSTNRGLIMREISQFADERIWLRPLEGKWAVGEHLIHLNKTFQTMITTLRMVTPFLYPFAWLNRERQYEQSMHDWMNSPSYQPMKTAPVLDPNQQRQSIAKINTTFEASMQQARRYFLSLDEKIAGNLILPYPPTKGKISVLQLSFALGYHERHHFRAMTRIEGSLRITGTSD